MDRVGVRDHSTKHTNDVQVLGSTSESVRDRKVQGWDSSSSSSFTSLI